MTKKKVLLLGLFVNDNLKSNIRTVEDRLGEMFVKENIPVIESSKAMGRISRLAETFYTVIFKRKEYAIAVVPLFGTWFSFLWQELMTRTLRIFNKKIILCIHGGSIPKRVDKGAKRFNRAMKRANILVAPSAFQANYFLQRGFDIQIVGNPVNLSEYNFQRKEFIRPRLIWMRAFTETYNPAMAVRLAKRLACKYDRFEMVMAGKDGPLLSSIKKMTEDNGLTDKIIFPGYINVEQKKRFAYDYDIYINTNKIDNAPVSVIEFMALGLPVVSVNVGGMPHLIQHEQNGLLVNDDDDEAMFAQICWLIENPSFAERIACNAYNYAQQNDEKNVIIKWKKLLSALQST